MARLHALLPHLLARHDGASLGAVMGGRTDEAALPGGDILAMLAPGAPSGEGRPDDPPAVAFELHQWATIWIEDRAGDDMPLPAVPEIVAWLTTRAGWAAAHHDAFGDFAADVHRILDRLEAVTGMHDRPEKGPPCPYCRTADLLRPFTDQGLADEWTCPACRREFNYAQYVLATRASLEDARAG